KSVRTEAASRRIVGPSRTRPLGEAAITSFSVSSAATMRCTVERARPTRCAICPRLRPDVSSSSACRIAAARAITCTWLFSVGFFGAATCLFIEPHRCAQTGNAVRLMIQSARYPIQPPEGRMVKKIALEEHFLCPSFVDYWNPTAVDLPAAKREQALGRLT